MKSFADLGRALTLTNLCRLFALLLVAWQPFPGEYRVPLVGSALLGLALTWRGEWRAVAEPSQTAGFAAAVLANSKFAFHTHITSSQQKLG